MMVQKRAAMKKAAWLPMPPDIPWCMPPVKGGMASH
jgi:hypothetical protein